MTDTYEYKQIFEARRGSGLPRFIKDECFKRGLHLEMDVEKTWFREHVQVLIKGPKFTVLPVVYALESEVTHWPEE